MKKQYIIFIFGSGQTKIDIVCSDEIIKYNDSMNVSNLHDYVDKIIDLRDQKIPVISLKKEVSNISENEEFIIFKLHEKTIGLLMKISSCLLNLSSECTNQFIDLDNETCEKNKCEISNEMIIFLDLQELIK